MFALFSFYLYFLYFYSITYYYFGRTFVRVYMWADIWPGMGDKVLYLQACVRAFCVYET